MRAEGCHCVGRRRTVGVGWEGVRGPQTSGLPLAAVDEQFTACDEARAVRGEEQYRFGYFGWLAEPVQWDTGYLGVEHALHIGRVGCLLLECRCLDRSWVDGVDADPSVGEFHSPHPNELPQR